MTVPGGCSRTAPLVVDVQRDVVAGAHDRDAIERAARAASGPGE